MIAEKLIYKIKFLKEKNIFYNIINLNILKKWISIDKPWLFNLIFMLSISKLSYSKVNVSSNKITTSELAKYKEQC